MNRQDYALFDTALGACAVAWGPDGLIGVWLPEADEARLRARLLRKLPDAAETPPPPEVKAAIDGIVRLFAGEAVDLSAIRLDMEGMPRFLRRIYDIARTIPPGETLTYGEVAERHGPPVTAREVGEAMGKNPFPVIVPCHRVTAAGGKLGGFSATGGVDTKRKLLAIEAAHGEASLPLFAAGRTDG